jgi:hypothetical protein
MNADRKLIKSIFNVDDLSMLEGPILEDNVMALTNDVKQRVINIIDYIRG